ncbi:MAG: hypothetical protein EOP39_29855, partial [Rubrivivax sp.]
MTSPDVPAPAGDFEPVASCATPTEAHLLKGVLEAAGLDPVTTDGHLLQAYDWLTPAVGGVRVLVPATQVDAASEALAAYRAGDYELPDEDSTPRPAKETLAAPIFSPDIAALLSFFAVSPAFGAGVQLLNARALQGRAAGAAAWAWFGLLAAATLTTMVAVARWPHGSLNPAMVAVVTSLLTAAWYFMAGQPQGRAVLQR